MACLATCLKHLPTLSSSFLAALLLLVSPTAAYSYKALCSSWRMSNNFPVYVDSASFTAIDGISESDVMDSAEEAINAWNTRTATGARLMYAGRVVPPYPSTGVTVRMLRCSTNIFDSRTPIAAVSGFCSNSQTLTAFQWACQTYSDCQACEANPASCASRCVYPNTWPPGGKINWATRYTPARGWTDLATVLTHELGHVLGLDDLYDSTDAVMNGFYNESWDAVQRFPRLDDRRGVQSLYGSNTAWNLMIHYFDSGLTGKEIRSRVVIPTTEMPAVAARAGVYAIAYVDTSAEGVLKVRRSLDQGFTWSNPIIVDWHVTTTPGIVNLADGSSVVFYTQQNTTSGHPADTLKFCELCATGTSDCGTYRVPGTTVQPVFAHPVAAAGFRNGLANDGVVVATVQTYMTSGLSPDKDLSMILHYASFDGFCSANASGPRYYLGDGHDDRKARVHEHPALACDIAGGFCNLAFESDDYVHYFAQYRMFARSGAPYLGSINPPFIDWYHYTNLGFAIAQTETAGRYVVTAPWVKRADFDQRTLLGYQTDINGVVNEVPLPNTYPFPGTKQSGAAIAYSAMTGEFISAYSAGP